MGVIHIKHLADMEHELCVLDVATCPLIHDANQISLYTSAYR